MAKAVPLLPIGSDSPETQRPRPGPAPIEMLPAARLFGSPLNPRRTPAPPEKEQELEDSIVAKGLLQPIVARVAHVAEPPKGATHEIICGNRRHGAILRAILHGRLPDDFPIPTMVREVSDEELIILAGIENLEREDMAPLDEAELYRTLRGYVKPAKGERAEALVARKLHVSERTVFRRLALLRLVPEAQEELRSGKLQLQEAAAIALGEPKKQREVLRELTIEPAAYRPDVEGIREAMTRQKVALKSAAFDEALYKGERIVDPESGETWLTDMKEFDALQKRAMAERIEALRKDWPWVKPANNEHWQYQEVRQGDKEAGAIVYIDRCTHGLVVKTGVISNALAAKRAAAAQKREGSISVRRTRGDTGEPKDKRYLTDGQAVRVKLAKSQAMRLGLLDHSKAGLALGCLALLCESEMAFRESHDWTHRRTENEHEATDAEEKIREQRLKRAGLKPVDYGHDLSSKQQAQIFKTLLALDGKELCELFAALLAEHVGSWFDSEHKIGDSPLAIAIADAVGAEKHLPATWKPDEAHFKAHGRDALEVLAAKGDLAPPFASVKKGVLVKELLARPAGTWTPDKFVECRFLTDADMKKAFAEASPAPKSTTKKAKPAKKAKATKSKKVA